jgi:hypothetical protein
VKVDKYDPASAFNKPVIVTSTDAGVVIVFSESVAIAPSGRLLTERLTISSNASADIKLAI